MKVHIVLLFYALVLIAVVFALPTDGTASGRLKVVLTVGSAVATLLSIFTAVALSSLIPHRDLESRTVQVVTTKPVSRTVIFAGKYAGIVAACAAVTFALYFLLWLASEGVCAMESRRSSLAGRELAGIVRVGRCFPAAGRTVSAPDSGEEGEHGQERRWFHIRPGEKVEWRFEHLRTGPDGVMRFRFKMHTAGGAAGAPLLFSVLGLHGDGSEGKTLYAEKVGMLSGRVTKVSFAAQESGYETLVVRLENPLRGRWVRLGKEGEMKLVVPAGSYARTIVKQALLVTAKAAMVASGTLCASTFVSFPVAMVAGLFLASWGYLVSFVTSAPEDVSGGVLAAAVAFCVRALYSLVPDFGYYDFVRQLVFGEYVSWSHVAVGLLAIFVLRGGVLLAVGAVVYSKRELGAT